MGKCAMVLGKDYGLTAQEMNFILKEEGFLEGEPGNYTVTEKGEKYATEQDYHRGLGGSSWYNRYWTTRTWDENITEELSIDEDRKKELRQRISEAKKIIREAKNEDIVIESNTDIDENTEVTETNNKVLVGAIIILLIAVSNYGVYRAAPYIKRWWKDKVVPGLKKNRKKGILLAIVLGILALFIPSIIRKK